MNGAILVIVDGQERQVNGRVGQIIRMLLSKSIMPRIAAPEHGRIVLNFGGDNLTMDLTETFHSRAIDTNRET